MPSLCQVVIHVAWIPPYLRWNLSRFVEVTGQQWVVFIFWG